MNWRIQTVTEIVLSELKQNRTLEELAQRVDLSPWHLSHLFKAELDELIQFFYQQGELKDFPPQTELFRQGEAINTINANQGLKQSK
jgi:AraC-like DNA-binding protein